MRHETSRRRCVVGGGGADSAAGARARPEGRGPRVSNRQVFTGIVFVLRTGLPWQLLPVELGCGSGSTCWPRFRTWTRRGLWRRLHAVVLQELAWADETVSVRRIGRSFAVAEGLTRSRSRPCPSFRAGCSRASRSNSSGTSTSRARPRATSTRSFAAGITRGPPTSIPSSGRCTSPASASSQKAVDHHEDPRLLQTAD